MLVLSDGRMRGDVTVAAVFLVVGRAKERQNLNQKRGDQDVQSESIEGQAREGTCLADVQMFA